MQAALVEGLFLFSDCAFVRTLSRLRLGLHCIVGVLSHGIKWGDCRPLKLWREDMTAAHADKTLLPYGDVLVVRLHCAIIFFFACTILRIRVPAIVPEFPDDDGGEQPAEEIRHAGDPRHPVYDIFQNKHQDRHQTAECKASVGHGIVLALYEIWLLRRCDLAREICDRVGRSRDIAIDSMTPCLFRFLRAIGVGCRFCFYLIADDFLLCRRSCRVPPLVDKRYGCRVIATAVRAGQNSVFHSLPFPASYTLLILHIVTYIDVCFTDFSIGMHFREEATTQWGNNLPERAQGCRRR